MTFSKSASNVPNTVIHGYGEIANNLRDVQQLCIPNISETHDKSLFNKQKQNMVSTTILQSSGTEGPTSPKTGIFGDDVWMPKQRLNMPTNDSSRLSPGAPGELPRGFGEHQQPPVFQGGVTFEQPIAQCEPKETRRDNKSNHCTTILAFRSKHPLENANIAPPPSPLGKVFGSSGEGREGGQQQ